MNIDIKNPISMIDQVGKLAKEFMGWIGFIEAILMAIGIIVSIIFASVVAFMYIFAKNSASTKEARDLLLKTLKGIGLLLAIPIIFMLTITLLWAFVKAISIGLADINI